MKYELVCGLETHVELLTKEKIFCACPSLFGGEPNTRVCPVCMGLPGTIPVLNTQAVKKAVTAALALGCGINRVSYFDRKNYFYPDLPKAYQISQYDKPFCSGGEVTLPNGRKIRIERIHLEEDAGKLIHENGETLIDYNRVGVPLIEIVTMPDFRSGQEAADYMEMLRLIMRHCGVSDCRMQEGSLRCDVNVSVRSEGSNELGTKTEIKNINSMSFVRKAIEYEFERQCAILEKGGKITPETRRWDAAKNVTAVMREKETAKDYRFMREPDLKPLILENEYIEKLRAALPELPESKVRRYISLGLNETDARQIAKHRKLSEFFDEASQDCANSASKLILSRIFAYFKTEEDAENCILPITAKQLNELALMLENKKINAFVARETLDRMLQTGKSAAEFVSGEENSFDVTELCRKAIETNPAACADFRNGKEKAIMSVIGSVMRETRGRADASLVRETIVKLLLG